VLNLFCLGIDGWVIPGHTSD